MRGIGRPPGKTFFLQCQRRHPELPKIPTYLPLGFILWSPLTSLPNCDGGGLQLGNADVINKRNVGPVDRYQQWKMRKRGGFARKDRYAIDIRLMDNKVPLRSDAQRTNILDTIWAFTDA